MNNENNFSLTPAEPTAAPKRSAGIPVIGIGLVAVAAFSFYQHSQLSDLRSELSDTRKQNAVIQGQIAQLDGALSGNVNDLKTKLEDAENATSKSIAHVRDAAAKQADAAAGKVQTALQQEAASRNAAVDAEFAGVKNAAADNASKMTAKIDGVNSSVDGVKTDLASTKAVADKTAADLQRATGDMGVMSGLIATNSKEIAALRAMGDRNIYEFNVTKKAGMQKIADIQLKLTGTNEKKNRYTMVLMADDKMIEKKDKTTNEPVQFYAAPGTRTPYEIVVNEVGKDTIKGYLATPKVTTARK